MENKEALAAKDAETAQGAIVGMILAYAGFPKNFKADNKTVRWNTINETASVGIFPLQGAVYIKKYVSGSYVAQMPYQIVYRSSPTTNKASLEAQNLLEQLAEWMENSGIEFRDPHMTLEAIVRTSPVFPAGQDEKVMDYAVNMQLRYFYKK